MKHDPPTTHDRRRLGNAKHCLVKWFDSTQHLPAELRPKLLRGLEAVTRELPHRSAWFEVKAVSLGETALDVNVSTPRLRAFPCDESLAVATVGPLYHVGWQSVLKDEAVYDVLSWFLHYASQYVHRSSIAAVLMIAWDEQAAILNPFGQSSISHRYGPMQPVLGLEEALSRVQNEAMKKWRASPKLKLPLSQSPWTTRNTLDPTIHQAICHFLRAQSLRAREFKLEAMVALDCVMQSTKAFLDIRHPRKRSRTRGEVCEELNLSSESAETAEYAYFIRNNFGAHPKGWRWWDIDELLTDQLSLMSNVANLALCSAADLEVTSRRVSPSPPDWTEWLLDNFKEIWDAVWYQEFQIARSGS